MNYRFADRMSRFSSSAVRDILKWTQGKDIISFAGGLPAEEMFPVSQLKQALDAVFEADNRLVFQYGLTEGSAVLRQLLSQRLALKGIHASPHELLVTTGSQQSIDLTARIFVEPGDYVLTENPTYLAALQVFQAAGATVAGVDRDSEGIRPELLEAAVLTHAPRLLYVIPSFANPTGAVWSLERRKQVLDICSRHGVVIVEDDPYGELVFDEAAAKPSLMALSGRAADSPVIYTGTFSKTVVPGLRTGWAAADEQIIRQLAKAKQSADLHSSCLDQQALVELLRGFDLDLHIRMLRTAYAKRMRTMAECLRSDPVWDRCSFTEPEGGMFLWLKLPDGLDPEALLPVAIAEGVAFVPGSGFFTDGMAQPYIRLNFSHSDPAKIREGMSRLTRAVARYMEQTGLPA
ncbi:MAG: aminotransferase [Paenibacillaceae bacterium]|jgi:2-aminoadipate transaminase|nr:aminotransferase [Paenibacillaceae bacterium]